MRKIILKHYVLGFDKKKLSYDYEHIIIDNSSDDKTVEILNLSKDKIKVIVNEKNYGHIRSPVHAIFQASRCSNLNDG